MEGNSEPARAWLLPQDSKELSLRLLATLSSHDFLSYLKQQHTACTMDELSNNIQQLRATRTHMVAHNIQ
jgi:hypothetical protein